MLTYLVVLLQPLAHNGHRHTDTLTHSHRLLFRWFGARIRTIDLQASERSMDKPMDSIRYFCFLFDRLVIDC